MDVHISLSLSLSLSLSPCISSLSNHHVTLDFTVGWQASSYAINEDDGSSPEICATGSGALQSNLMLDITAATVDGTATGTYIRMCGSMLFTDILMYVSHHIHSRVLQERWTTRLFLTVLEVTWKSLGCTVKYWGSTLIIYWRAMSTLLWFFRQIRNLSNSLPPIPPSQLWTVTVSCQPYIFVSIYGKCSRHSA